MHLFQGYMPLNYSCFFIKYEILKHTETQCSHNLALSISSRQTHKNVVFTMLGKLSSNLFCLPYPMSFHNQVHRSQIRRCCRLLKEAVMTASKNLSLSSSFSDAYVCNHGKVSTSTTRKYIEFSMGHLL